LIVLIFIPDNTKIDFNFYVPFNFNLKSDMEKILDKYQIFMDCFNVLLTTMNSMIGILFWTIYCINKETIFPKRVEHLYPVQLNLFIHGITALIMWCHNLIYPYYKIHNLKYHRLIMFTFNLSYGLWVITCYIINGWWAYDFLNRMNYFQHFIFLCTVTTLCMLANEIVCHVVAYRSQKV